MGIFAAGLIFVSSSMSGDTTQRVQEIPARQARLYARAGPKGTDLRGQTRAGRQRPVCRDSQAAPRRVLRGEAAKYCQSYVILPPTLTLHEAASRCAFQSFIGNAFSGKGSPGQQCLLARLPSTLDSK